MAVNFKKGTKVVKIIHIVGCLPVAALGYTVHSNKKGAVVLSDEGGNVVGALSYRDSDGGEIDPAIPGCYSEIVEEDGQE